MREALLVQLVLLMLESGAMARVFDMYVDVVLFENVMTTKSTVNSSTSFPRFYVPTPPRHGPPGTMVIICATLCIEKLTACYFINLSNEQLDRQ